MSTRSRRSARLFPGVRLNFNRGGISTSVAARGAGTTLGATGSPVNPGASATLLSYRSALTERQPPPRERGSGYAFEQWTPPHPPPAEEIGSEDLEEVPGLDDLQGMIDEVAEKRRELAGEIALAQAALARAKSRLRFARAFIVRLLTVDAVPGLAREVDAAAQALAEQETQLDACFVEVDFGLDERAAASYAKLLEAFEALAACDAIWDVAAKAQTDRAAVTESTTWTRVRFSLSGSDLVKSRRRVGRMENASAGDLCLFPGFVMMRDAADDVALVEYQELEAILSTSEFVVEDEAPADAARIGETWKKTNEDGSPDPRFAGNCAIPIVLYGEMLLRTPSGLNAAYVFSNYASVTGFARALENHRKALTALAAQGGVQAPESAMAAADEARPLLARSARRPAPVDIKPRSFVADWATLALLLAGLTWGVLHSEPAPPPAPAPAASTPAMTKAATHPVAKKPVARQPVRKRPSNARATVNDEKYAAPAGSARAPGCGRIRATINPEAVTCY